MRCEELEAIVFSGREITAEERAEMEAHAETCEACRALMDNADALRGMQRIDEDVTPPESFTRGWRMAIRQTPRVISISDWMRRKGVRVVGYAACAALVFAAGTGVGRLGGNEKNVARTAYNYDYGAYDTYEAYPQEDAVALYENSAPALGARSAAEKGAANDSTVEDEKKIVRNAWLTLKTERFDEAVSALCGQIEQAGGVAQPVRHGDAYLGAIDIGHGLLPALESAHVSEEVSIRVLARHQVICRAHGGLHHAARGAKDHTRARAKAQRRIERLLDQRVNAHVARADHAHHLAHRQRNVHVGRAALAHHARQRTLGLLGRAWHNGHHEQTLGLHAQHLGVVGLGDSAEHLLRRL